MRSFRKKLLLAAGGLVLACALAEALLRLLQPVAVGISHQPCIYVRDETNGYAYRPGSRDRMHRFFEIDTAVAINADGCHDVDRPVASDGGWRVAAIGDSFTACLHVPVAEGWTQVLEHELGQRRGTRGEVRNLGRDGTGTEVQVRILDAWLQGGRKIDTAILCFYGNDVEDTAMGLLYREVVHGYVISYQDDAQRAAIVRLLATHRPAPWVAAAYRGSLLFRALVNTVGDDDLLRSNFLGPAQAGLRAEPRHAPQAPLERAFRDLAALAAQHAFDVVIVPVPARHDPAASRQVLADWVPPRLLATFTVVDVLPALERRLAEGRLAYADLFWQHDGHLNAAGNRLFALSLADALTSR